MSLGRAIVEVNEKYYNRDFWAEENLKYQKPHFRLEKAARLVNKLADGRQGELLDVGCGPAALRYLLDKSIQYFGIDIAIHDPKPYLIESDFAQNPIKFGDRQFDFIVAQGIFEYIGNVQEQKFADIQRLLKKDGTFVVTYVNFDHLNRNIYWPYNNIQPLKVFQRNVKKYFHVNRYFPTSHRWHHDEPRGRMMWALQKHININLPLVSRMFGVEYFFICSK
jgi:SAM-dependent methyltransferase